MNSSNDANEQIKLMPNWINRVKLDENQASRELCVPDLNFIMYVNVKSLAIQNYLIKYL